MRAHAYLTPPIFKMAELGQCSDKVTKITCRSRRAVNIKNKLLFERLTEVLEQNKERSNKDRKRYLQKFMEIFEKVTHKNTVVSGDSEEEPGADKTSEFEPVDKQLEVCIKEELLPELDDCVVKVAKLRKRLPPVCCNAISDFSNHQAMYLSKVKPITSKVDLDPLIIDIRNVQHFINLQQLQEPCALLTQITKTASKAHERAIHLSKASKIIAADKNCHTATVLYGPSSLKQSAALSSCDPHLGKRKLDVDVDIVQTNTKLAKSNFMLASDFVVHPLESERFHC